MANRFFRQFGGPTGWLGSVAGRLMARMNGPLNDWAVELLELSPGDRALEIGFGPGLGIERIAARVAPGPVAGVDHSELMRRHAALRNRAALASGRVELHVGTAGRLAFGDRRFSARARAAHAPRGRRSLRPLEARDDRRTPRGSGGGRGRGRLPRWEDAPPRGPRGAHQRPARPRLASGTPTGRRRA